MFYFLLNDKDKETPKSLKSKKSKLDKGKDIYSNDVFIRLKIKKEDAPIRVAKYLKEKGSYPTNVNMRMNKYFNVKETDNVLNREYDLLGKCMESELQEGGVQINTDNEFLESLKLPYDEESKKKRVNKYEVELKATYKPDFSPTEIEKFIRLYWNLKTEKLIPLQVNRLHKIMKEEVSCQPNNEFLESLKIPTDEASKKKRIMRFDIEIRANYNENASPDELEKMVRLYWDLKTEPLTPTQIKRLNELLKDEIAKPTGKEPKKVAVLKIQVKTKKKPSGLKIASSNTPSDVSKATLAGSKIIPSTIPSTLPGSEAFSTSKVPSIASKRSSIQPGKFIRKNL